MIARRTRGQTWGLRAASEPAGQAQVVHSRSRDVPVEVNGGREGDGDECGQCVSVEHGRLRLIYTLTLGAMATTPNRYFNESRWLTARCRAYATEP